MKNHELIAKVGGIEKAREIVAGAKDFWFAYDTIDGEYMSGGDIQDGYSISDYEGCIVINDLRTAIAEHDAPEFKVGDLVVLRDSPQERVLKVQMFQDDFIRAFVGNSSDYSFGHKINFRHATPSEIQSGHRELLGNSEQLDEVTDIKYHVSPSCKVSCHHQWINQDYLGCTEHHYFCAYCSEKKTEVFGVDHESE